MLRGHFIFTAHVLITFRSRTLLQERGKPVYAHAPLIIIPRMRMQSSWQNMPIIKISDFAAAYLLL